MAAVTPTNMVAYGFETNAGSQPFTGATGGAAAILTCIIACGFTGTYAQGTGYAIGPTTIESALSSARRDGATYSVWSVSPEAPGQEGGGNGGGTGMTVNPALVMAGPVTFAGPTSGGFNSAGATGLLYVGSTAGGIVEHGPTAMQAFETPVSFRVTFTSQAAI